MRPTFKDRKVTKKIMLHDSHTTPDLETAIAYLQHNGRKMGLIDCGYHYAIERDGTRIDLRPEAQFGAAAPGHDLDAIHVVLIGGRGAEDVAENNFTEYQMEALYALIYDIRERYPDLPIVGHDEVQRFRRKGDTCPCLDMFDLRADYVTWLQTGLL